MTIRQQANKTRLTARPAPSQLAILKQGRRLDGSDFPRASSATRVLEAADAYPQAWDEVAEIRVFRASQSEWQRLISWRSEMGRKGWKLLRVNTKHSQIVAIFGRTRGELIR